MNADNYHSHHHYHQQTQQQHQQQFQHQSLATCTFSVSMYHFLKSLHCTLSRAPTLIPLFDFFAQIFNMIILVLIGRLQCEFQLTYNISHCPYSDKIETVIQRGKLLLFKVLNKCSFGTKIIVKTGTIYIMKP